MSSVKSQENSNTDLINKNSPEMRARRLKRVRNLANLTREQMCQDGDINRHTLISWENARFGGLTMVGAEKILEKITKAGVYCSAQWLMQGEGPEPSVNPIPSISENETLNLSEEIIVAYELAFFKAKNLHSVDLTVDDDGMLPHYKEGDVVAGKQKTGSAIDLIIGNDCIVQTDAGEVLLRNVRKGKYQQTYTLVCNNPNIKTKPSVIADTKLLFAAPVIWHRRKDII